MTDINSKTTKELLEIIVKSVGVSKTLSLLGDVCADKSTFWKETYPDGLLVKSWEYASVHCKKAAGKVKQLHGIT